LTKWGLAKYLFRSHSPSPALFQPRLPQ
jgi:hypothetical protein